MSRVNNDPNTLNPRNFILKRGSLKPPVEVIFGGPAEVRATEAGSRRGRDGAPCDSRQSWDKPSNSSSVAHAEPYCQWYLRFEITQQRREAKWDAAVQLLAAIDGESSFQRTEQLLTAAMSACRKGRKWWLVLGRGEGT